MPGIQQRLANEEGVRGAEEAKDGGKEGIDMRTECMRVCVVEMDGEVGVYAMRCDTDGG